MGREPRVCRSEPKDTHDDMNYLVIGPWRHSQVNGEGWSLGPLKWDGNTVQQFKTQVLLPFFNQYLKDGAPGPIRRRC